MFQKKIKSFFKIIKNIGLSNFVLGYSNLFIFKILSIFFNFDNWHANNPYYLTPYKKYLVSMINELNPSYTIDIGCGLAEILLRVNSKKKLGIDVSKNVIKANRFIYYFSNISWKVGSVNVIKDLKIYNADLICMINWLHIIPPHELKTILVDISKHSKYVLVDKWNVKPHPPNIFVHDFEYLYETMTLIKYVTLHNSNREYLVFKSKLIY